MKYFNIMTKSIVSYGIACCRVKHNCNKLPQTQVLVLERKHSYPFLDLVFGKYQNATEASRLAAACTSRERDDILTLPYEHIWRRIFGGIVNGQKVDAGYAMISGNADINTLFPQWRLDSYTRLRNKYMLNVHQRLSDIIRVMSATPSSPSMWELPKGRPSATEGISDCAAREFVEETGFSRDNFHIMFDAGRFLYKTNGNSNSHNNITAVSRKHHQLPDDDIHQTYRLEYFLAEAISGSDLANYECYIDPVGNLTNHSSPEAMFMRRLEVSLIRWVGLEDADKLDPTGRLKKLIKPVIRCFQRRTRGQKHLPAFG